MSATDPDYYRRTPVECIDIIESLKMPYHLGCAMKYLWRWDQKNGIEDLQKAVWYINRFIARGGKA